MNQRFENRGENSPDEFEKRLSRISLLAPSERYGEIPQRMQPKEIVPRVFPRLWLTAGVLASVVLLLALTASDILNFDVGENFGTESLVAESNDTLDPIQQSSLQASQSMEQQFVAGNHYVELQNPLDMSDSTVTEVAVFFWYPCWPCSEFEELLTAWEETLGADVTLHRIPAIWSPAMRFHARAYYTAQVLGVLDRSHRRFYTEFKKDSETISDEEELMQFFQEIGISAAEFQRAYNSAATLESLEQADAENFAYQLQSTPAMFVAGRYGISPGGAGGFRQMLEVANFLIEREQN